MKNTTEELKQQLQDYLAGMASAGTLDDVIAAQNWQQLAAKELERRRMHLLQCFPDDMLEAFADGRIDLAAEAARLAGTKQAA